MAKTLIELLVNGDSYEVAVEPWQTLAEILRDVLGFKGTKIGCNQGDCGACTVILDGVTVCSCITLAVEAAGRAIRTIEGVAPSAETLHPVQEAFVEKGAIQCGFCTSGMILSGVHLLEKNPSPTEKEIRHGLSGNLCRCTGYNKIVEAIESAATKISEPGSNS
jgi:aerobic carbon-monoxide dehydrogenase small subunit